ncbi:ankyrin repeat-containing domain protein [Trichoderma austrokoningii]
MAVSNVSANNHANGPQILYTGGGPQNNNNDKGLQINNSSFHGFSLSDLKPDKAMILQQEKQDCLRSLSFEFMDARKEDISHAHPHTCDWLFETSQFQQWHHRDNLQNHNGVLWIKGHLGTGKSTLMKHTLRHLEENSSETHVIAAHFFNARGDYSEQTPLFMLRSLLYQMLEKEPSIYELFVPLFRDKKQKHDNGWKWRDADLKNFLLSNIKKFQSKPLFVLVDALDECEETHVRDVVGLLETLSDKATNAGVTLNICLSSRHYPHIGMRKHLELVVEQTSEHDEDIFIYTRDNLAINDKEIEKELLEKASGVFMWVVLVIKLLNQAYDEGKIEAMHKTLHKVPRDLEIVFEKLSITHNRHKHETLFMLQFVLVARRLITPEELYFATLAKTGEKIEAWDQSRVTPDAIRRRITNSSRGLIEVCKGEVNTVQFIHKLQRLDPDLGINALGTSHECLRSLLDSPILFRICVRLYGTALRAAAIKGNKETIELLLEHGADVNAQGGPYGNALYAATLEGRANTVQILLENGADVDSKMEFYGYVFQSATVQERKRIMQLLIEKGANTNPPESYFHPKLQAATTPRTEGHDLEIMLSQGMQKGASPYLRFEGHPVGLAAAMNMRAEEVVALLLDNEADINAPTFSTELLGAGLRQRAGHSASALVEAGVFS